MPLFLVSGKKTKREQRKQGDQREQPLGENKIEKPKTKTRRMSVLDLIEKAK